MLRQSCPPHRGVEAYYRGRSTGAAHLTAKASPCSLQKRRLSADCVEKIGSCRGTAAVIQSGPWDWSAADDGGTSERAGRSVLRVFARTSCASGASTAID